MSPTIQQKTRNGALRNVACGVGGPFCFTFYCLFRSFLLLTEYPIINVLNGHIKAYTIKSCFGHMLHVG